MHYLVDRRNRAAYGRQLEEMFAIRHRVYVETRGWAALARADKREVDQFDNDNAVYLLGLNALGAVQSGVRLVPTTQPTLMRDIFPHTVPNGKIPCSDKIYEMSRFFLTEQPRDKDASHRASGELLCAMFEYGLARRLTHFTVVCDAFFLPLIRECRHRITMLGPITPYAEGECMALLSECRADVLASTERARGVTGPSLTFSSLPPPQATEIRHAIAA